MSAAWLLLYLAGLAHLLALVGFGLDHGTAAVALLPVAAVLASPLLQRNSPLPPGLRRASGLVGFGCALAFVKSVHLEAWDPHAWTPTLLVAGAGLGSLLPALDAPPPGPGTWLWIAFWLGTGVLDPALPLLGAGLAGVLEGSGLGLGRARTAPEPGPAPWGAVFLLGFTLPKPWWDFALEPGWALPSAAVGVGAALASLPFLAGLRSRLPRRLPAFALGILAVLYGPALALPWGLAVGLAAGLIWTRLPHPLNLARAGGLLLAGLVLSYALHANLWLPGLRRLLWLGA